MVLQTEFVITKNNNLYIDEVKATDLAEKYEHHFYMLCPKDILDINSIYLKQND